MSILKSSGRYSTLLLFFALVFIPGCNRDEDVRNGEKLPDPLAPSPAVSTTISGIVINEEGQPLEGATVEVQGSVQTTGFDGTFLFSEIDVPGNRCVVSVSKSGYFSGFRGLVPTAGGSGETRIVLMERLVTHDFAAADGINAMLSDGSAVKIEPASLVLPSGLVYTGDVNMSVRYLDPSAGNFGQLVPGGDMIARREDQTSSILYSYGILRVEMWTSTDEKLQIMPGKTATLTMNIPEEQQDSAPNTIPLWYFDEQEGLWQEEGFATRSGNAYTGTVSHFTDWNCDVPSESAIIKGRLIDCDGNPGWGTIEFGQITSDPQRSTQTGEDDGRFVQRVPARVQITIVLTDPLMITPLTKDGRGKVIIIVPPLAPEQVYDIGDIQIFPCPVEVTATVQTSPGDHVYSIGFSTEHGSRAEFNPGSDIRTTLPPNLSVKITVMTALGILVEKNFVTGEQGGQVDLGIIDARRNLIESEAIINGKTLCHGIPEVAGQVSVHWENENGSNSNYSNPLPDGTFVLNAPNATAVTVKSTTPGGVWERSFTTPSNAGEVVDLGSIEICDNMVVGKTEFRITGDGFADSLFLIVSNQNMKGLNSAAYYPGEGVTFVSIYSLSQDMYFTMAFPGQKSGKIDPASPLLICSIKREMESGSRMYLGGSAYTTNLDVEITKYDDVGGAVEGTFSGTFRIDHVTSTETVTITDGKFSALRYEDEF